MFLPPTVNFAPLTTAGAVRSNNPDIKVDGRDFPEFHPILTTDYFEFGTSAEPPGRRAPRSRWATPCSGWSPRAAGPRPRWLVVRNARTRGSTVSCATEPDVRLQAMWAVFYYASYGYWTSWVARWSSAAIAASA